MDEGVSVRYVMTGSHRFVVTKAKVVAVATTCPLIGIGLGVASDGFGCKGTWSYLYLLVVWTFSVFSLMHRSTVKTNPIFSLLSYHRDPGL